MRAMNGRWRRFRVMKIIVTKKDEEGKILHKKRREKENQIPLNRLLSKKTEVRVIVER